MGERNGSEAVVRRAKTDRGRIASVLCVAAIPGE